jgi:hypothetical protein
MWIISLQKSGADVTPDGHNGSAVPVSGNTSMQSDSTLGFSSVEHPLPIAELGAEFELEWKCGTQTEEQTLGSELDELQK